MTESIDESPEEKEARYFFEESLGLMVTRVPSSASKMPDFLVDGEKPGYVLEVKSRFDDEDFLEELKSGYTAERSQSIGYSRWAEDRARKAHKQLISCDPTHERFWVIWFSVKCLSSPEAIFDQCIGTLYGVRQVVYWDEASQKAEGRDCLFIERGVFERWPDIDGAIITSENSITLCVNEFSVKAKSFESSLLYKSFERLGGPVRPSDLEANRGFLSISDRTIERSNEETVRHYLSKKYMLRHVYILNIKEHSAWAMVQRK